MSAARTDLDVVLPVGKLPAELLGTLLARNVVSDKRVIVGPGVGRDAAVISFGDQLLVAKSDPITFASDESPHYLVNVNANDLACVGAEPRWLMVTALLPEGVTTSGLVTSLFDELIAACSERGIALVGGHTEVTAGLNRPILIGMMLGESSQDRLISPGNAKPGDRLMLTSPIAVEGTALIARELAGQLAEHFDDEFVSRCANFLHDPGISIAEHARALIDAGGVTALHDPTEGGLASGIREIAMVSNCGAVVNRRLIPVLPETEALCRHFGLDPLGLLASGSLLAAVAPDRVPDVEQLAGERGFNPVVIGKLTVPERGFSLVEHGIGRELPEFIADEVVRLFAQNASSQEGMK